MKFFLIFSFEKPIKLFWELDIYGMNKEINELIDGLSVATEFLKSGGKLIIISFHSVEDRKVKHCFKKLQTEKKIKILTKKPITPTQGELKVNSRSKSAKMRVAEKIA